MTTSIPATSSSSSSTSSSTSTDALTSISSNYNEFLTLLTTQLQNQDPSNPMDTSQFTSELAQFAGVQQQVATNTNLTSLISLTQAQQLLSGTSLIGKQVQISGGTLPLQNGAATASFTSASAQPVTITVTDSNSNVVTRQTVNATSGTNSWSWNGTSDSGTTVADGPYTIAVTSSTGTLTATATGTVTAVTRDGSSIDVSCGTTSVDISKVSDVNG